MSQLKIKNGGSWEAIPAGGIGVPSGGSSGQYLRKSSSTDYATQWADPDEEVIYPTYDGTGLVDISGYTSNYYTAPSDGYIWVRNASNKTGTIYVVPAVGELFLSIGGATTSLRSMAFVRKGARIKTSGTVDAAYYAPLDMSYS